MHDVSTLRLCVRSQDASARYLKSNFRYKSYLVASVCIVGDKSNINYN